MFCVPGELLKIGNNQNVHDSGAGDVMVRPYHGAHCTAVKGNAA